MKIMSASLVLIALGSASASRAGTVTEIIPFAGSDSAGIITVNGPVFDPTLGTLTGVSLTASGALTPNIFVMQAVTATGSVLEGLFDPMGSTHLIGPVAGGSFDLTQQGNFLTGPPEPFSFTQTADSAAQLHDFTGGPGYTTAGLENLYIYSVPAIPGAWGQIDPLSAFSGTLTVTYTYQVPEPGSFALLGLGTMLVARRRKRRRQVASVRDTAPPRSRWRATRSGPASARSRPASSRW